MGNFLLSALVVLLSPDLCRANDFIAKKDPQVKI